MAKWNLDLNPHRSAWSPSCCVSMATKHAVSNMAIATRPPVSITSFQLSLFPEIQTIAHQWHQWHQWHRRSCYQAVCAELHDLYVLCFYVCLTASFISLSLTTHTHSVAEMRVCWWFWLSLHSHTLHSLVCAVCSPDWRQCMLCVCLRRKHTQTHAHGLSCASVCVSADVHVRDESLCCRMFNVSRWTFSLSLSVPIGPKQRWCHETHGRWLGWLCVMWPGDSSPTPNQITVLHNLDITT